MDTIMKKKAIDSPSDYMEMFARLAEARASMHKQQEASAMPKHDVPVKQINAERFHDFPPLEAHLFSLLALD